jgi:hypothetical protein
MTKTLRSLAMLGLFIALGVAAPVGVDIATGDIGVQTAEARRGRGANDNPATHDVGDDHGGSTGVETVHNQRRRGRGR